MLMALISTAGNLDVPCTACQQIRSHGDEVCRRCCIKRGRNLRQLDAVLRLVQIKGKADCAELVAVVAQRAEIALRQIQHNGNEQNLRRGCSTAQLQAHVFKENALMRGVLVDNDQLVFGLDENIGVERDTDNLIFGQRKRFRRDLPARGSLSKHHDCFYCFGGRPSAHVDDYRVFHGGKSVERIET